MIKDKKASMRCRLRDMRRQLNKEERMVWDQAITAKVLALEEYQKAKTVFCFVSYGGEPETRGIISHALSCGKSLCVPRCIGDGVMECVRIGSLDDLEKGFMGIMEPKAGLVVDPGEIDFAVVPGIAFTPQGVRLGQGGGYYDRFIQASGAYTCGICYKAFLIESIPCESHDMTVSCVVTQ